MSNESIDTSCGKCEGEVKCDWRGRLSSQWHCIQCGTIYRRQPRKFIDDNVVGQTVNDIRKELISQGIIKPDMRLVSKIVMKRLKLGTMSYYVVV